MITTIIIFLITIFAMMASILFFPKIRVRRNFYIDSYWIITLLGACIMLMLGLADVKKVGEMLIADTAINPIKILLLFISMTMMSIFLDELGFFRFLATITLKKAKSSQFKLFLYLYIIVSILTVFTSNDIIILSFTPFICYFAKNAKINPIPYLATEFVAANTWSMMLIIGNPTNIYLASSAGIDFISYLKVMALPTLLAGITAFIVLYLMFRKSLLVKIPEINDNLLEKNKIKNKALLIVGIIHLAVCTILLAISSYIELQMWLVCIISLASLFISALIVYLVKREKPVHLLISIKRAPWSLVPFILSMFTMIIILSQKGLTQILANFFGNEHSLLKYGVSSFLISDVINNIPMSVLFCDILNFSSIETFKTGIFATIIGSNLGALFTPIGALAGIMWNSILLKQNVKFSFLDFVRTGIIVSIPTLCVSLLTLGIVL